MLQKKQHKLRGKVQELILGSSVCMIAILYSHMKLSKFSNYIIVKSKISRNINGKKLVIIINYVIIQTLKIHMKINPGNLQYPQCVSLISAYCSIILRDLDDMPSAQFTIMTMKLSCSNNSKCWVLESDFITGLRTRLLLFFEPSRSQHRLEKETMLLMNWDSSVLYPVCSSELVRWK